jgi:chemosensory pili system protein ChpB (putative protein-glutamate methylesterase)
MMAAVVEPNQLRVSIISDSAVQRAQLSGLLESNGMKIIESLDFEKHSINTINAADTDVLVLDLDDEQDYELDFLDDILSSPLPVLFNDSAWSRTHVRDPRSSWARSFVEKISSLVQQSSRVVVEDKADVDEPGPVISDAIVEAEVEADTAQVADGSELEERPAASSSAASQVWVLGASIGGPQAVKRFMAALPGNLPVAFILAQHIGNGFEEMLAKQLDRASEFKVSIAEENYQLRHRELVITPVNRRILLDRNGCIQLKPTDPKEIYTPSIDAVMVDMAIRYGARSGAIIFSGMGQDGMQGCRVMSARGASVWAQEADSCVVSGMPDAARRSGVVSFSGTPEQLAEKLVERFAHCM